jgi:hypothetical protein
MPDQTAYAVTATIPLSVLPKFPIYCRFIATAKAVMA